MITDLCNTIIRRPNAVDFKALVEEIKRRGSSDLNTEEIRMVIKVINTPEAQEEYTDFIEVLTSMII